MTGAHNFFRLYAPVICDHPQVRGISRTLTVSAVPHSNHQTVGAASWQNNDSSPPAVSYYTAQQCLSRSIKPLHFPCIMETT